MAVTHQTPISDAGVQGYFERGSAKFDSLYDPSRKSAFQKFTDWVFHQTIQKRFEMTLDELAPFEGKRLLDTGCGPGRYSVEFAVRGAEQLVGLDFSGPMLKLAEESARARGVADRCRFIERDVLHWETDETFDATVSVGFFEYFRDVQGLLNKLASLTTGTLVISFPKRWDWRVPMRAVRYKLNGCYLRFFTRSEIEGYVKACQPSIRSYKILETDRDYLLIAKR